MIEPALRQQDRVAWDRLRTLALCHARTVEYRRAVDKARSEVGRALYAARTWAVMWSGGKDSTAMAHLICEQTAGDVVLVSEKDDLDYPGETEYVTRLAERWGARLEIVTPKRSPAEWIRTHGMDLAGADDVHGRSAGLSKACFYNEVEASNVGKGGIFLGLRAEESNDRSRNRSFNGLLYQRIPTDANPAGLWVSQPIADWTGLGVFAYLLANGIDPLPVYRCIGLMHAREPWRVRKSWWIPGSQGARGQVTWLRHYWPSLYLKLCGWVPSVKGLG